MVNTSEETSEDFVAATLVSDTYVTFEASSVACTSSFEGCKSAVGNRILAVH